MSMPMKNDPPPMKTEEQPSAKKVHKILKCYLNVYALSYKFVINIGICVAFFSHSNVKMMMNVSTVLHNCWLRVLF